MTEVSGEDLEAVRSARERVAERRAVVARIAPRMRFDALAIARELVVAGVMPRPRDIQNARRLVSTDLVEIFGPPAERKKRRPNYARQPWRCEACGALNSVPKKGGAR